MSLGRETGVRPPAVPFIARVRVRCSMREHFVRTPHAPAASVTPLEPIKSGVRLELIGRCAVNVGLELTFSYSAGLVTLSQGILDVQVRTFPSGLTTSSMSVPFAGKCSICASGSDAT